MNKTHEADPINPYAIIETNTALEKLGVFYTEDSIRTKKLIGFSNVDSRLALEAIQRGKQRVDDLGEELDKIEKIDTLKQ